MRVEFKGRTVELSSEDGPRVLSERSPEAGLVAVHRDMEDCPVSRESKTRQGHQTGRDEEAEGGFSESGPNIWLRLGPG